MPEYRFYAIHSTNGLITRPPTDQDLPNDAAALEHANQLVNGVGVEIWQGARIVAKLDPKD
jgi:hypothetical protein